MQFLRFYSLFVVGASLALGADADHISMSGSSTQPSQCVQFVSCALSSTLETQEESIPKTVKSEFPNPCLMLSENVCSPSLIHQSPGEFPQESIGEEFQICYLNNDQRQFGLSPDDLENVSSLIKKPAELSERNCTP